MINKIKVAVVGAGTMGNGIAHVFALSEISEEVILVDLNAEILELAEGNIIKSLTRQLSKNFISKNEMTNAIKKIKYSTTINSAYQCNLFIEAVKEDLDVKINVFEAIDKICNSDTILATNTSSISISKISASLEHKKNVIGMHFMNPVPIMKLVEIIKGEYTSNSILKRVLEYVSSINKIPIECNDSPGFISNRILMPMINEASYALMEGVATPEAIDGIMKLGMSHPMGPLKLADLIGIDVCVSIMNVLKEGFNNKKYTVCPLLVEMVEKNKLGIKTKEGFYKY